MTPFSNLSTTISNFWTSNTNINEIFSGYYIPVILKISGILTTTES